MARTSLNCIVLVTIDGKILQDGEEVKFEGKPKLLEIIANMVYVVCEENKIFTWNLSIPNEII